MATYWLNVDIPTKNCRLHQEHCKWARGKYATPLKGIAELRQDGGWLEFDSTKSAEDFFQGRYGSRSDYEFVLCKGCF